MLSKTMAKAMDFVILIGILHSIVQNAQALLCFDILFRIGMRLCIFYNTLLILL